jgi:phospholipid-transporting ATPase
MGGSQVLLSFLGSSSSNDQWNDNKILFFIKTAGTWLLLFSNFIPISLLLTLELAKYFQGMFMEWDHSMFHIEDK